jgi:HSP20 family protein
MDKLQPFSGVEQIMNSMFNTGVNTTPSTWITDNEITVDVVEDESEVVVTADVPGFGEDELEVSINDNMLTIVANRVTENSEENEDETVSYVFKERNSESASRTITLPVSSVDEEATATYRNGVLTVTIPKEAEIVSEHQIEIE